MERVPALVECPGKKDAVYPPIHLPNGRVIAWNQKPGTTEKFLVFIVQWHSGTMEIFRKSIYKADTLCIFNEKKGFGNVSPEELDDAIEKESLFSYSPPEENVNREQEAA